MVSRQSTAIKRGYKTQSISISRASIKITKKISFLAKYFEEYQWIKSVPGIGDKIAATIISDIGDINQFEIPKRASVLCRIGCTCFESGKFKASINRITKRGSSRLRHSLYMAVQCGLAKVGKDLFPFMIVNVVKASHKVAVIACANKPVHWICAMLKRQEVFVDQV